MGIFSKRPAAAQTLLPPTVLGRLGVFGAAALNARSSGRALDDPQFGWEPFLGPAMMSMRNDVPKAIRELHAAAGSDPVAMFGASQVVAEYDGSSADPLYFELLDGALAMMKSRGFSSGNLTGYESQRWIAVHGDLRTSFDGIVENAVPDAGAPLTVDLAPGQSLKVAAMGPDPLDNTFFVERTDEGYRAYSLRVREFGDTELQRYDEPTIGTSDALDEVFRRMGSYLRIRPYWALPDLDPYFPDRRG